MYEMFLINKIISLPAYPMIFLLVAGNEDLLPLFFFALPLPADMLSIQNPILEFQYCFCSSTQVNNILSLVVNSSFDVFFFSELSMAARATKDWRLDCKVYIGDLGYGAAKQEIEDVFQRYGHLRNVWVARNPPGFAFVEFQDPRDAEDATKALDGT